MREKTERFERQHNVLRFLAIAMVVCVALPAWAEVRLFAWMPAPDRVSADGSIEPSPRIVLPRLEDESPREATLRYLRSLHAHPELSQLLPASLREKAFDAVIANLEANRAENAMVDGFRFAEVPDPVPSGRSRVALISNDPRIDLFNQAPRMRRNTRTFQQAGGDPYVLAMAADVTLSPEDQIDYRRRVARGFDLLVALGGDDVDPSLYGQEVTHAKREQLNKTRDASEIELIRAYKSDGRGVFFGICRGHQLGAVADGHSLIQDLSADGRGRTEDHVNPAGLKTRLQQTFHHIFVSDSLLGRLLRLGTIRTDDGRLSYRTNSLHHQAVDPRAGASSSAVAHHDGEGSSVEALEMRNRLGLSIQWHAEFPVELSGDAEFSSQGVRFLRGLVAYSRLVRIRGGARVFRCGSVFN